MFADSHCHLNYKGLVEGQQEVLARARARGVHAMLNIATRESEWDAVIATAERESDVWATVGIHPHEADKHPDVGTARLVERAQAKVEAPARNFVASREDFPATVVARASRPRPPARELPRAYRGGARDAVAAGRPYSRCRGRHRRDHAR